jgi:hypothetical protein
MAGGRREWVGQRARCEEATPRGGHVPQRPRGRSDAARAPARSALNGAPHTLRGATVRLAQRSWGVMRRSKPLNRPGLCRLAEMRTEETSSGLRQAGAAGRDVSTRGRQRLPHRGQEGRASPRQGKPLAQQARGHARGHGTRWGDTWGDRWGKGKANLNKCLGHARYAKWPRQRRRLRNQKKTVHALAPARARRLAGSFEVARISPSPQDLARGHVAKPSPRSRRWFDPAAHKNKVTM